MFGKRVNERSHLKGESEKEGERERKRERSYDSIEWIVGGHAVHLIFSHLWLCAEYILLFKKN